VIPEITIKISMRPDEFTITQGQTETREESFTIPSVPEEAGVVLGDEHIAPPLLDEELLMYTEDQYLAPPAEEAGVLDEDENIPPPEVEADIPDRASDDMPDFPIGE
jgi:hypothetical protein